MKKVFLLLGCFLCLQLGFAQTGFVGKWKSVNDETGIAESIIDIYERNGKLYGKVIKILIEPNVSNPTCRECPGDDNGKPILGLEIIKGLQKDGDTYVGKILDPKNGKLYECYIKLKSSDVLKLRGYIGISLFGKTQYWERAI